MNKPDNQSSLDNWVDWLLHLHPSEIDLGLERIRIVAERMNLLRPAPIVISVAGTNGKGSSVAMLSAILQAAGYKVGTYTSPHIVRFNERIQINNELASDQQIIDAFTDIESQRENIKLTYFEFSTLAALKVFSDTELDVVVLEVGLGGRLDAVNVVDADAALITAIGVDHIEWLGDDRNQIAVEKAGIMRPGKLAICSDPEVPQTLISHADENNVNLSLLNRDFFYGQDADYWNFCFETRTFEFDRPALLGDFQFQNAAGVIALLKKMHSSLPVSDSAISIGLKHSEHPGRLEKRVVGQQNWLIDVAHNPQSAEVLAEYLQACNFDHKPIAVFSALQDKDMLPMVEVVAPFVNDWFIADLNANGDVPRATGVKELATILESAGIEKGSIFCEDSISMAVDTVRNRQAREVLAWGSFFTVAQVIQALEQVE